jgi:hypothetical protein
MSDSPVGIDRIVQPDWLETVAQMYIAGSPAKEIANGVHRLLEGKLSSGKGGRGSLEKTVTVLMRTWVTPPRELIPLRDDGIKLLQKLSEELHPAVHWGMLIAAYPFWGAVAETTGKLLSLQGTATMAQIVRRIREQLGERQTVTRSAQRAVRSFVNWGTIVDTDRKGTYKSADPQTINDPALTTWLLEAVLRSSSKKTAALRSIVNSYFIFPYKIKLEHLSYTGGGRLEYQRQGMDEDVVMLKSHTGMSQKQLGL